MPQRFRWRSETVRRFAALSHCNDPVVAVRRKAADVVRGLPGPPFHLACETVQRLSNIKAIRYAPNVPGDGRIFIEDEAYVIEINSRRPETRRAFTLAHEIGHTFFLPLDVRHRLVRLDSTTETFTRDDEEEYLCDIAASEFLMPTQIFLGEVCKYGPSVRSLLAIARAFRTSLTSTARRFAEVEAWRCHVGFWQFGKDGILRYQFGFASGESQVTIPKRFAAPAQSIVAQSVREFGLVRGRSDIGLMSRHGEKLGEIFAEAVKLRGNETVISVAILDRYPEQLCAMYDFVLNAGRADAQIQFRFPPSEIERF